MPLPNNKFLHWFKLKELADEKINVTEKLKFVLRRVENMVGKGQNAGYQHFVLFPQCFQKSSLSGSLSWDKELNSNPFQHPHCFLLAVVRALTLSSIILKF